MSWGSLSSVCEKRVKRPYLLGGDSRDEKSSDQQDPTNGPIGYIYNRSCRCNWAREDGPRRDPRMIQNECQNGSVTLWLVPAKMIQIRAPRKGSGEGSGQGLGQDLLDRALHSDLGRDPDRDL